MPDNCAFFAWGDEAGVDPPWDGTKPAATKASKHDGKAKDGKMGAREQLDARLKKDEKPPPVVNEEKPAAKKGRPEIKPLDLAQVTPPPECPASQRGVTARSEAPPECPMSARSALSARSTASARTGSTEDAKAGGGEDDDKPDAQVAWEMAMHGKRIPAVEAALEVELGGKKFEFWDLRAAFEGPKSPSKVTLEVFHGGEMSDIGSRRKEFQDAVLSKLKNLGVSAQIPAAMPLREAGCMYALVACPIEVSMENAQKLGEAVYEHFGSNSPRGEHSTPAADGSMPRAKGERSGGGGGGGGGGGEPGGCGTQ